MQEEMILKEIMKTVAIQLIFKTSGRSKASVFET